MIVGIDLGTTNSAIGVFENGQARLLPNAFGSVLTPSVVGMSDSGTVLIGQAAKDRLVTHPGSTQAVFKRYMGSDRKLALGTQTMRAEELSSLILRSLKHDAEAALGASVTQAVISVPAYFNNVQREATKLAGQLAGLEVVRLINEPTAAAMAYSLHDGEAARQFLIFDLGGGTFDVSILDYFDGVMEVKASTGDTFLGGEDFTRILYETMLQKAAKDTGEKIETLEESLRPTLYPKAEQLKIELSAIGAAQVRFVAGDKDIVVSATAEEFEHKAAVLLDRLRKPIERAMRDARLVPSDLDSVILVGGATRMRMIHKMVSRLFGRLPRCHLNPDEVVAMGAAIQAGLKSKDKALEEKVLTDVSPHTLGVEVARQLATKTYQHGAFLPIIERNTMIPCSYVESLSPVEDKQTAIALNVYEGESRFVEDNVFLGKLEVPIETRPATQETVSVRFTYDVSGLLEVEATRQTDRRVFRAVIEKSPHTLKPAEIAAVFANLSSLKLHPKEDLPNVALVNRARRMYEEALGEIREAIAISLERFLAALETQDREQVAKARSLCGQELDELERHFRVFDP